jgi:hypothetical protein
VAAVEQGGAGDFLSKLRLETPDKVLNTAFAFAKIRAAESIKRRRNTARRRGRAGRLGL